MAPGTSEQVIARARARFDDGEYRAAWDSLLVRVRREPEVLAYRDALSEFYRRAGHPDQAARWGAHDLASLDRRELRALKRSLRQFPTEREVQHYLVLPTELPSEVTAQLESPSRQRLIRWEPRAEELEKTAYIIGGFFGGPSLIGGVLGVQIMAFLGDPEAHSAAQIFAAVMLMLIVFVGVLLLAACLLRARWVRSALLICVVGLAVAGLSSADMTNPLPFG